MRDTGQAALGQSVAGTSLAGVSLFPRAPRQGFQHDRGLPHERVPQDPGRTVTNAQNTTLHHMTRTRQTKGATSSESSAFCLSRRRKEGASPNSKPDLSRRSKSPKGLREDGPVTASRVGVSKRSPQKGRAQARTRSRSSVFTPSATKMQETRNKMPIHA